MCVYIYIYMNNIIWYNTNIILLLLLFSHSVMSNSLWPHGLQHTRPPCPSPSPRVCSNLSIESVMPPNHLILYHPLLLLHSIFPSIRVFPTSQLLASCGQSIRASASASLFPMNIQGWFPLRLTGLISCHPRDSQESSPTPQFKSIDSLVLRLPYGPSLTSIHDYWKSHSIDYMNLCWEK